MVVVSLEFVLAFYRKLPGATIRRRCDMATAPRSRSARRWFGVRWVVGVAFAGCALCGVTVLSPSAVAQTELVGRTLPEANHAHSDNTLLFDGPKLQRLSIWCSMLPPASVASDESQPFWQRYQWQLPLVGTLVALQTVLIIWLLVHRAQRRRIEAELAKGEQRYMNLLANTSEMLWCIEFEDPPSLDLPEMEQVERFFRARVVEANEAFATAYGSSLDDVIGTWRVEDFVPRTFPTSEPIVLDVVRSRYRMEEFESIEQAVNGETKVFVNSFIGTIENGRCLRVWGMCRDVTETREVEKQIRVRQAAIESSDDAFLITDAVADDMPVVFVNDRFTAITGYSREETIGRNCRFLQGPETDSATVEEIRRALKQRTSFAGEILNYRKNGEKFWNYLRISPVFDKSDDLTHFVATQSDVTDRRNADSLIIQQKRELAHVSRLATFGEIGAALAHELNQPLAAILRNSEAAQRMLQQEDPDLDEIRQIFADILRDDRRAGKVLARIRLHLQKKEQPHSVVNLNEVVRESLALINAELLTHRLDVQLQLADNLPSILGDSIELQQVIINLVLNAENAMRGQADRQIIVIATGIDEDGNVKFTISDNGPGIHQRDVERVFNPFHSTKQDGMGMGLAINRTIINGLNGKIWVQKSHHGGATIVFTIPAIKQHESAT